MELKPGSRWKSAVCNAEIIVVRATKDPVTLECGGQVMGPHGAAPDPEATLSPDMSEGVQVGKRYVDEQTGVEVLCTKAGKGSLSLDGRPLSVKEAKALPASD